MIVCASPLRAEQVAFNGAVHFVMYGYYACCLLKIKLPGFIRMVITSGQLVQFFASVCGAIREFPSPIRILTHAAAYSLAAHTQTGFYYLWWYRYIPNCHKGARQFVYWYTYVYVAMLVVLFSNFFIKSYINKPKAKASRMLMADSTSKPVGSIQVGDKGTKQE